MIPEADGAAVQLVGPDGVAQLGEARVGASGIQLRRPLKRGVRLRHEAANADRAANIVATTDFSTLGDDARGHLGDLQHVLVGLGRQAAHKVKLHLPPAIGVRRSNRADQVFLADHLVDDLAQPLAAALGREGQAGPTSAPRELVGQVDVERIDAGRGQRQPGVGALVTVRQTLGDLGDLRVVGAREAEQTHLFETRCG